MDTSHLDAIFQRLDRERERAELEPTPAGKSFRRHNIEQIERELSSELKFLGIKPVEAMPITDADLLKALTDNT